MLYTIPVNILTIIDDDIYEVDQSFALVAQLADDVPDNVACFQRQLGESECHGRRVLLKLELWIITVSKNE